MYFFEWKPTAGWTLTPTSPLLFHFQKRLYKSYIKCNLCIAVCSFHVSLVVVPYLRWDFRVNRKKPFYFAMLNVQLAWHDWWILLYSITTRFRFGCTFHLHRIPLPWWSSPPRSLWVFWPPLLLYKFSLFHR